MDLEETRIEVIHGALKTRVTKEKRVIREVEATKEEMHITKAIRHIMRIQTEFIMITVVEGALDSLPLPPSPLL